MWEQKICAGTYKVQKGVQVEKIIKLQQKVVPELIDLLEKRHDILRMICYNQPIGRRILAIICV